MTYFSREHEKPTWSARDLAAAARLPQPTVTKILKALTKEGLLMSTRGVNGGYRLARRPAEISVADVITALEGPIAITQCSANAGGCDHETFCPARGNWQLIDQAVRDALQHISLHVMSQPMPVTTFNPSSPDVHASATPS